MCLVQNLLKIGPVVLEKKFLNFVNVFSLFYNYLLLETELLTEDPRIFVLSLLEICTVVLAKKFFLNFVNVYFLFHNYLPLIKGGVFKLESPSHKCIVPSLVDICPVVLEKKFFKFHKCIFAIL